MKAGAVLTSGIMLLVLSAILSPGCSSPEASAAQQSPQFVDGTITYVTTEGGFYGIVTDSGDKLYPLNLDPAFMVDGTRVRFAYVKGESTTTGIQWGKPVTVTSMSAM